MALPGLVSLPMDTPIWEHFPTVAPLVLVATQDLEGTVDIAPKHLAMPVSWQNWFGFVCHPSHTTYLNIVATRQFTVGYPKPDMLLYTSLAAAPRAADGNKPTIDLLATHPAETVDGVLVAGCQVNLECVLHRSVTDLGDNVLVIGKVVAAHVAEEALRTSDRDVHDLINESPLLAYVHPGRVATIRETSSYPYHRGFRR